MTLFIDADACPVVEQAIRAAKKYQVEVVLITDTAHEMNREGARTIIVEKGNDAVDFKLVNLLHPGDLAITQDYGLAAMALARGALVLNQNGLRYTDQNIDALLLSRHLSKKIRLAGGRTKGPAKRTEEQNMAFDSTIREILEENKGSF